MPVEDGYDLIDLAFGEANGELDELAFGEANGELAD